MKKYAIDVFHKAPENLNCAQAVLDAWHNATGQLIAPMEEFKAFGGGRAPDGECGALYAACRVQPAASQQLRTAFAGHAGAGQCSTLKCELHFPCAQCVGLAAQLLEEFAAKKP